MGLSSALHAIVGTLVDAVLWPVSGWPAEAQAALLGLPGALLALAVHRGTANQQAIARAKDRIKGHLLELRLFRDDLRVLLRAQCAILRHNAAYLGHSLVPLLPLSLPFFLLLVQLEARFGWSAVAPGTPLLLTADVDALGRLTDLPVRLDVPAQLRPTTGPLRIEATRQLVWRLAAADPGEHRVTLAVAGHSTELRAVVGDSGPARVSAALYRADQAGAWAAPGAPLLAGDSGLRSVHLSYPRAAGHWLGLSRASWSFAGSTLLFAFALRRRFGVVL
jgi:hypothetical protein